MQAPTNFFSVCYKARTKLVNSNCPFLYKTEDNFFLTSPTNGVAVLEFMSVEKFVSLLELVKYEVSAFLRVKSCEE